MKLCGFADEISPELDEQIKTCKELGVTHFNVPLSYYGIGLDALGELLKALRAA